MERPRFYVILRLPEPGKDEIGMIVNSFTRYAEARDHAKRLQASVARQHGVNARLDLVVKPGHVPPGAMTFRTWHLPRRPRQG